jgi:hypothetical protein
MLEEMANVGDGSIVSWQPHGKAFRVHLPEVFAKTVMPRYFKQTKYKSFQRQLHLYGFHRIHKGMDRGAYCHSMFIRNKTSMSLQMTRQKIKGNKKTSSNVAEVHQCAAGDPDFCYTSAASVDNKQYQDGRNLTNTVHSDPHGDEGFFAGKRFFHVGRNENVAGYMEDCFSAVVNRGGGQKSLTCLGVHRPCYSRLPNGQGQNDKF